MFFFVALLQYRLHYDLSFSLHIWHNCNHLQSLYFETREVKKFKIQCILKVCMVKLSMNISSLGYLVFMSTFNDQSTRIGCEQVLAPLWFFPTLPLKPTLNSF